MGEKPSIADRAGAYTLGSIRKTMFLTGLTMLPATLAISGYQLVDSYYVGQLRDSGSLAAMSNASSVIMFAGCVFMGIGTGITATLAHSIGRRDSVQSRRLVSGGLLLAGLVSFLLCVLGLLFGGWLFQFMGVEGETLAKSQGYLDIWLLGCITAVLSMEGNTLLITAGLPRLSSVMTMVGLVLNMLLDPPLIFGWGRFPGLGINGAAIATICSQSVSAAVNLYLLHRHGLLSFVRIPLNDLFCLWGKIIRYAIPAMLGTMLLPLGMYINQRFTYDLSKLKNYGDDLVAGMGLAGRLEVIAFVIPMALGRTLMPMMAQNFGARLYSRVRTCFYSSVVFAQCFLLAVAILFLCCFSWIAPYMAPGQPRVQEVMVLFMSTVPFSFGFTEGMRFSCFLLLACGHPRLDALSKVVRVVLLSVPLAWLALYLESVPMLLLGRVLTDVIGFCLTFYLACRCLRTLPEDGIEVESAR